MATSKKKAVVRKISGHREAFRPAQLLSARTSAGDPVSAAIFSRLAGFWSGRSLTGRAASR